MRSHCDRRLHVGRESLGQRYCRHVERCGSRVLYGEGFRRWCVHLAPCVFLASGKLRRSLLHHHFRLVGYRGEPSAVFRGVRYVLLHVHPRPVGVGSHYEFRLLYRSLKHQRLRLAHCKSLGDRRRVEHCFAVGIVYQRERIVLVAGRQVAVAHILQRNLERERHVAFGVAVGRGAALYQYFLQLQRLVYYYVG